MTRGRGGREEEEVEEGVGRERGVQGREKVKRRDRRGRN